MSSKIQNLATLCQSRIIAIIRATDAAELMHVVAALSAGGVSVIEVTMTTPNALRVIAEAVKEFGTRAVIGAGTVLDATTARMVIEAGGQLVVTPVVKPEVIEMCRRYSAICIPGAMTPTEMLTAWEAGADMVKLFPASQFGPGYITAVKAPLPQLEIVATGGIELANAQEYLKAGSAAIGVGSPLLKKQFMEKKDWAGLTKHAAAFVAACKG